MKVAAALAAVFLMLGASVAGSYFLSAAAADRATANRASILQLCQAGNEARAQQVALWEKLVTLSTPPPRETAEARAQRMHLTVVFLAYVRQVFAPRNCAAITDPRRKP